MEQAKERERKDAWPHRPDEAQPYVNFGAGFYHAPARPDKALALLRSLEYSRDIEGWARSKFALAVIYGACRRDLKAGKIPGLKAR